MPSEFRHINLDVNQVKEERERRLKEAAMLERHIMQAQARALSADEREAARITSATKSFPNVYTPPGKTIIFLEISLQIITSCEIALEVRRY